MTNKTASGYSVFMQMPCDLSHLATSAFVRASNLTIGGTFETEITSSASEPLNRHSRTEPHSGQ